MVVEVKPLQIETNLFLQEKRDYFGFDGCCLTCSKQSKGCLCYACKCKKCFWYSPPEEWDGVELRHFIAEAFQTINICRSTHKKRIKECNNEILIKNLLLAIRLYKKITEK